MYEMSTIVKNNAATRALARPTFLGTVGCGTITCFAQKNEDTTSRKVLIIGTDVKERNWNSLSNKEAQDECAKRGLSSKGKKVHDARFVDSFILYLAYLFAMAHFTPQRE